MKNANVPKSVNLDFMTKKEFDEDMKKRYDEALRDDGVEAKGCFKKFNKK